MIIFESKYGAVFRCQCCDKIALEFGNIYLKFASSQHFLQFQEIVNTIDAESATALNINTPFRRKIFIDLSLDSAKVALMSHELEEMRYLLGGAAANLEGGILGQEDPFCRN